VPNQITRKNFIKQLAPLFGACPFLLYDYGALKSPKCLAIITPKISYIEPINVGVFFYTCGTNKDGTIWLEIETKDKLPYDHCNYPNYSDILLYDNPRKKLLTFKNISFEWLDNRLGRHFSYHYNYGQYFESKSLVVL